MKWKNRQVSDATWVLDEEVCRLAQDILGKYQNRNSMEWSSFQPGRNDRDRMMPKISCMARTNLRHERNN